MSKTFAGGGNKRHATSHKVLNAAQDSYLLPAVQLFLILAIKRLLVISSFHNRLRT